MSKPTPSPRSESDPAAELLRRLETLASGDVIERIARQIATGTFDPDGPEASVVAATMHARCAALAIARAQAAGAPDDDIRQAVARMRAELDAIAARVEAPQGSA